MLIKGQIRLTGGKGGEVFDHGQTYYTDRLSDNVFLIAMAIPT